MREIYFGNLRSMVIEYVREIESGKPEANSILWYLLKYLRRIIKVTEPPARPGRVDGAIQSLIRFYIGNIDERSEQGRICTNIYDQYRKVLRKNQTQDSKRG